MDAPPVGLGFVIVYSVLAWLVGSLFGLLTNLRLISIFKEYREWVKWAGIVTPGVCNALWLGMFVISCVWGKQEGEVNQTSIAFLQAICALLPLAWPVGWSCMAGLFNDPSVLAEKKS